MATISRESLYDLVWAEPVRTVAERLGVSDVWLKKCCTKTDVPVPDRGYWAKLRAGKIVTRRALPPRAPGAPTEVTIGAEPQRYRWPLDPEAELAAPPPVEPAFNEPIEAVKERVEKALGPVRLVRNFTEAHDLIRRALDDDELRRLKPRDAPYRFRYSDPLFDAPFERRRLRILNSLFLALAKAGHQPSLGDAEARDIGVKIGGQSVSFVLDHPKAATERNARTPMPREAYEILRLEIRATGDAWIDAEDRRIEDWLRDIILKLIVAGEVQYRANARRNFEHACRHRVEMERKIAEQRAEATRIAREQAIKAEAARHKALLQMAADHRAAQDIRAFVGAAVEILAPDTTKPEPLKAWAAWALRIADRADPLHRLQITDDGAAIVASLEPMPPEEHR